MKDFTFIEAEREGFEPPEVLPSTVFKTAAIDHSAISPFSVRAAPEGVCPDGFRGFCVAKVAVFFEFCKMFD